MVGNSVATVETFHRHLMRQFLLSCQYLRNNILLYCWGVTYTSHLALCTNLGPVKGQDPGDKGEQSALLSNNQF